MKLMHASRIVVITLFAGLAIASSPLAAADLDARIQRVEHGLRSASVIKAQPNWTIAERLKFYKTPGVSVAVIADGKVAWARGYGVTAEDGKPVDADTIFQAASISKPVAAMVALHLVDEGKLSLDDDVNLKLRSWKVPENEFTRSSAALRMAEIWRGEKNSQKDGEGDRELACHRSFLSKHQTELSRNMGRRVYSSVEEFEVTGIASLRSS